MDNGGKWLLVVLGAIMALVLLFAGAVPLFQATIEHTQQSTIEDMIDYWLDQGYVAYADPDGTLHVYDVEPNDDDTYDLGTAVRRFQDIYGMSVYVDGTLYVGSRTITDNGTQLKVDDTFIGAPGTPDYVVGVNTATDDVPGSTGYWVKSGSTGEIVRLTVGATNADDSINWAEDTVSAKGGGKILLTSNNLTVDDPVIPKQYVHLQGSGGGFPEARTGTWLVLANGADCDVIQYLHPGGGVTYYDFYGIISDLAIDGNKANNASGNGMNFDQCRRMRIENVFIGWCKESGLKLGTGWGATLSSWFVVDQCTMWGNTLNGIWASTTGSVFSNINCDENGASGFKFSGNLIECYFLYSGNNGGGVGIPVDDQNGYYYHLGNESAWVRCWAEGNVGCGYFFDGLHAVDFTDLFAKECMTNTGYPYSVNFYSGNTHCVLRDVYVISSYANMVGVGIVAGTNENIQIVGGTINMVGTGQTGILLDGTSNHRIEGLRVVAATPLSGGLGTGTIIKDNIGITAYQGIAARVSHNADQTINTGATTYLAFNTERFDIDAIHDTVTNNSRLTCTRTGKYVITANVAFSGNATGVRWLIIQLNHMTGIATARQSAVDTNDIFLEVSTIYDLVAGDYVEVEVYQTSGGDLLIKSYSEVSPIFTMHRIDD